jgi:excisionase family DNA binding protein
MDNLLTVDEAARVLRIARRTMYRRIQTGHLRAVRLGDGPKAPLRVEESELERYAKRSSIGSDVAERARRIVELRNGDPTDAGEYIEALREAGYAAAIFADKVERMVHSDMEQVHRRGYSATAAGLGSDAIVNTTQIVSEELAKLGTPLPVAVAAAGPRGVDLAAKRILAGKGITEFDAASFRRAVKLAISDLRHPKRKI